MSAPDEIDRRFEAIRGPLKPSDLPKIDWSDKAQVELLFPLHKRALVAHLAAGGALEKSISLSHFNLKAPLGDRLLFEDTKLVIEPHKRCALVGDNGVGKSALFRAVAAGEVPEFPTFLHVHHMRELDHESPELVDDSQADGKSEVEPAEAPSELLSVIDTVVSSHPLRRVLVVQEEVLADLVEKTAADDDKLPKYKANLEYVRRELQTIGADTTEHRAMSMLRVLGFDDKGVQAPMKSLSGGMRMRVALAAAFIIDADITFFDEPTNHLDLSSVLWLENKLRAMKGSYVLVTHDRVLLENVVTSVIHAQDQALNYYAMGFKEFERTRETRDQERDDMIDKWLRLNKNISATSHLQAVKRRYQDWQTRRQERLVLLRDKFTFKPPPALTVPEGCLKSKVPLITVKDVTFQYAEGLPWIFKEPINFEINASSRVGAIGPNGAGKSTFLKLATGSLTPTTGTVVTNEELRVAYFGQHSTKELRLEMTPLEFMCFSFPEERDGLLREHLQGTGVGPSEMNTRMRNLSISQRACVIFAKLTYTPPHLIILDEPTNGLDLGSIDSLANALNKYKGAIFAVTHNRDFLKRVAQEFLSVLPGSFQAFDTMREAERATYSFISAMEDGRAFDAKSAITDNQGGGAAMSDEALAARDAKLQAQRMALMQEQLEAEEAEAAREAKAAKRKADKAAAIQAAKDKVWESGETCYVMVGKNWMKGSVKRAMGTLGISVELSSGKMQMFQATQLKTELPSGASLSGGGGGPKGKGGGGGARAKGKGAGGGAKAKGAQPKAKAKAGPKAKGAQPKAKGGQPKAKGGFGRGAGGPKAGAKGGPKGGRR